MGVPAASLKERNLRLSVQRHLRTAWSAPADLSVGWTQEDFDPDDLSAAGADPLPEWAAVSWISSRSGGAGGWSLLQVDVVTRVAADPAASRALELTDSLSAAMRVSTSLALYDFSAVSSADDEEVLISGNRVLVQGDGGRLGARADILGPVREREVWRVTSTYRVRLLSDASSSTVY